MALCWVMFRKRATLGGIETILKGWVGLRATLGGIEMGLGIGIGIEMGLGIGHQSESTPRL